MKTKQKKNATKTAAAKFSTKMYRLVPELIPEPLWGISAYRHFGKTKPWKEIRQDALTEAGHKCGTCDADGPQLACHDKWSYDDKTRVATLIGFEIRCILCHNATHVGRAIELGFQQDVVRQLCEVNRCTEREVVEMINSAMSLWEKRSKKKWTVAVAPALLTRYPRLAKVPLMVNE
jgi:hypothetical protein